MCKVMALAELLKCITYFQLSLDVWVLELDFFFSHSPIFPVSLKDLKLTVGRSRLAMLVPCFADSFENDNSNNNKFLFPDGVNSPNYRESLFGLGC